MRDRRRREQRREVINRSWHDVVELSWCLKSEEHDERVERSDSGKRVVEARDWSNSKTRSSCITSSLVSTHS